MVNLINFYHLSFHISSGLAIIYQMYKAYHILLIRAVEVNPYMIFNYSFFFFLMLETPGKTKSCTRKSWSKYETSKNVA